MNYLKQLFTALLLLCSVVVNAYDFEKDGIYYYITDDTNKTVRVTYRESTYGSSRSDYTGNVLIPATVTYNNLTYTVTSISSFAFEYCTGLTEITGRAVLPPVCGDQALDDINKWNCKLYVPSINLKSYNNAEQWKEFLFVEELVTTDNYVTYKIDEDIYKTLLIKPGERIVLPAVENREGYVFSGWKLDGYISAAGYPVMLDKDITITGSFVKKGSGIDEVTDGILLNMEVYDLNGHRIVGTEHLERGIYIINGKKVFVK